LGRKSFDEALVIQQETVQAIARGISEETVFLLEHLHVFTLGRRGEAANLLSSLTPSGEEVSVVRTNRGGDITYHGPGQLVVYPHLDLTTRQRDLHDYLRQLEEVVIRQAAQYGVQAYRREALTGVWTRRGKLASIGVGVRNWITMHGLALNVQPDLSYFKLINPCGMEDCPVTSFEALLGRRLDMGQVIADFETVFRSVFEAC
jgi:lipoate-protein ligase B